MKPDKIADAIKDLISHNKVPNFCPKCGCEVLSFDVLETKSGLKINVICDQCGAEWVEYWEFKYWKWITLEVLKSRNQLAKLRFWISSGKNLKL